MRTWPGVLLALALLVGCSSTARPAVQPGVDQSPPPQPSPSASRRPAIVSAVPSPSPTDTASAAASAAAEARATAVELQNERNRGSNVPLVDPLQLLPPDALLPGWQRGLTGHTGLLDALGQQVSTNAGVEYRASPGSTLDGRATLLVGITVYASRVSADDQVHAGRHPNPEQEELIPLPGGLGEDAVGLRILHPAPDFKSPTADTTVRFDNVVVRLTPYYPLADADLVALTQAVVRQAQAALASARRFDWDTLEPAALRPWTYLPSVSDLGPDWRTTSRIYTAGQNPDIPLIADQRFERRTAYGQILETLEVNIATYTSPAEAGGHLRNRALLDVAAVEAVPPPVGDQALVQHADQTTSARHVLLFRRGRMDVAVDLSAAPDIVDDHVNTITRGIDTQLQSSGGGLR